MLKRVVIAVATACLTTTAFARDLSHVGELHSEHDRFKRHTTITSANLFAVGAQEKGAGGRFLQLLAQLPDDRTQKDEVSLLSYNYSAGWKYMSCNDFAWLVDGRPFAMPAPLKDNEVLGGGLVSEVFIWPTITPAQLGMLANTISVEWKICNDEYKLTDEALVRIRDFQKLVRSEVQRLGPAK